MNQSHGNAPIWSFVLLKVTLDWSSDVISTFSYDWYALHFCKRLQRRMVCSKIYIKHTTRWGYCGVFVLRHHNINILFAIVYFFKKLGRLLFFVSKIWGKICIFLKRIGASD